MRLGTNRGGAFVLGKEVNRMVVFIVMTKPANARDNLRPEWRGAYFPSAMTQGTDMVVVILATVWASALSHP
jgi:hypothetical protein